MEVLELAAITNDCSVEAAESRCRRGDTLALASTAGEFVVDALGDLGVDRPLNALAWVELSLADCLQLLLFKSALSVEFQALRALRQA